MVSVGQCHHKGPEEQRFFSQLWSERDMICKSDSEKGEAAGFDDGGRGPRAKECRKRSKRIFPWSFLERNMALLTP